MKLGIVERIQLLGLLPKEGDITMLRLIRDAQQALAFSEEEIAAAEITTESNRTQWNPEKAVEKEIAFGDATKGIIVDALKKLNEAKQLTINHLPLYERFVDGKG